MTHITKIRSAIRSRYMLSYALVALFSCASSVKEEVGKEKILSETVFQTLQSQAFAPQEINDEFSLKAFDQYLKNLDANKRFLLQTDVDNLRQSARTIDDDIRDGDYRLMRKAEALVAERTKEVRGFYTKLLEQPFDFTADESIEFDYDKRQFAKDSVELREEWRKYLKYQALLQIAQKTKAGRGKQSPDSLKYKLTPEVEKAARESVKKSTADFFRRLAQVNESDRQSEFINAITHLYDPHTDYLAPANKDNFDIQLSGRLEGIGATLNQKDGYVTVADIVAGQAAWRQGQLKTNDQIIKVAQDKEDAVDVTDWRLDDAIKLIRGKKGTRVVLTVRKPDNSIVEIPIVRDVVILQETYAKSAMIKENSGKATVGYIDLPSFYADFNRRDGRHCSDDVRDEIKKLLAEGAKSIIFDLRNNGGGSLQDVVRIVGFFIDRGPVVQVKTHNNAVSVYEDRESGTLFNGPLVVLVNPFSASASEIFAAAIQDYNRGIIMGSTHTFGKGTVQQIIDLDQVAPYQYDKYKPLGSVKLTTQKFYRINGGATQIKGVASDVVIPDVYRYLKFGEKELDNTLPWDQISPAKYVPVNGSNTARAKKVMDQARQRIAANEYFQAVDKSAQKVKVRQDEQTYTLNIYKYAKEIEEADTEDKRIKALAAKTPQLKVEPFAADAQTASDTLAASARKKFYENIGKDSYIHEAVEVLKGIQ